MRLPLPDVSRRHCRFSYRDGRWWLTDLNSLNGVYVNDRPVREAELRGGDLVRVGGFVFRVELAEAAAAREPSLAERLFPPPEQRRAS